MVDFDYQEAVQKTKMLEAKFNQLNQEQEKIDKKMEELENAIDLYNECHFIKSGFIKNGP